ncbi:MAG: AmmeMemoRadiSam system protein A [Patescibacteria group bacterium]
MNFDKKNESNIKDSVLRLANDTISACVENKPLPKIDNYPELLETKAGCFVSIHRKSLGDLRGCIGTITPIRENLALEIIHNAASACSEDGRFWPIEKDELKNLDVSVDILSKLEPIDSSSELNPEQFGVVVRTGDGRSGVLLPDLPGIDSIDEQVRIAKNKAGIQNEEIVQLFRFSVVRIH